MVFILNYSDKKLFSIEQFKINMVIEPMLLELYKVHPEYNSSVDENYFDKTF